MNNIVFRIASEAEVIQARRLCLETYVRMGYISQPEEFAEPVDNGQSVCIVATDRSGSVVGALTVTLVVNPDFFKDWGEELFCAQASFVNTALRARRFSIGALVADRRFSGLGISLGLYHAAYKWALACGMSYAFIKMDLRAFRALRIAGWQAVEVGPARWYLGSYTVPAIVPINEQHPDDRTIVCSIIGKQSASQLYEHH